MREIKFRAWDGQRLEPVDPHMDAPLLAGDVEGIHLMQYTGLKDKHGKEIYEGDIVNVALWDGKDWTWEEGLVKWYQPSSAFKWFSVQEDPSDANNYWLSQADEDQRQVIGNIYENPELLEAAS